MRIKYAGPFDAVELPALGLLLEQGEEFDVDDDAGKRLLEQRENYSPVDAAAKEFVDSLDAADSVTEAVEDASSPEELRSALDKRLKAEVEAVAVGLDVDTDNKTKADLIDAIVAAVFPNSDNEES